MDEFNIFTKLKIFFLKLISRNISKEFFKFSVVGVTALIFETCLIFVLYKIGIDPKYGRIISIPLAILLTWYLNRTFTFKNKNQKKIKQYGKYFFVIIFGISINYSIYLYVLQLMEERQFSYVIAICCGSLSSMFFNFGFAKYQVFKD